MTTKHLIAVAVTVCASIAVCGQAAAQITPPIVEPPTELAPPNDGYPPTVAPSAAGPYFARPAWGQTLLPNVRFIILTNMQSHAVLDRETGLVWARQAAADIFSDSFVMQWRRADGTCRSLVVGNRGGWRLPTVGELRTLVDFSVPGPFSDQPRFPAGHPFVVGVTGFDHSYWTSDPFDSLWTRFWVVNLQNGVAAQTVVEVSNRALCVRGAQ
jgi:hypothetical protein